MRNQYLFAMVRAIIQMMKDKLMIIMLQSQKRYIDYLKEKSFQIRCGNVLVAGGHMSYALADKGYIVKSSDLQREYPKAEIINPALVNSHLPKSTTHEEYMRMSFCMLDMADSIYMIPNWKTSCGASQEYGYALTRDKIILVERS